MTHHVAILMGTLNGARYLPEQLASFEAQSHRDWSLHVSDDGSRDATRDIIAGWRGAPGGGAAAIHDGPREGSAANYFSLMARGGWPRGAWVALSDQDDVWMETKLARAISAIEASGAAHAIYASRTILTDQALTPIGPSRLHPRPACFGNALTQNILAGNTIVLSPKAAELACASARAAWVCGVAHHDWWLYLLMAGSGAALVHDPEPGLYYRQHSDNTLGASRGLSKAMVRFAMILDGRYGDWMRANVTALTQMTAALTPESRAQLARFEAWLHGTDRGWLGGGLAQAGIWRQTRTETALLRAAAFAGRL